MVDAWAKTRCRVAPVAVTDRNLAKSTFRRRPQEFPSLSEIYDSLRCVALAAMHGLFAREHGLPSQNRGIKQGIKMKPLPTR